MKIACIGEAMVEVALTGPEGAAKVGFAGDVLNTAIYLRRELPADHEVAFVSMIGRDRLSDQMAEFVAAEAISTRHLSRHPDRLPGLYTITTTTAGERSFAYWRDRSAARRMFSAGSAAFAALAEFDVIYLSAITLAILPPAARSLLFGWIDSFRAGGGRMVFDSNYRPRLWPGRSTARQMVERAWRSCDIALPSVDDEMALFGDQGALAVQTRLAGWGITAGALKCGAAGPLPLGRGWTNQPAFPPAVQVVDTTAAGDSFNGGYLAAHLCGATPEQSALAGHACATRVIGYRGAIVPKEEWQRPG